MLGKYILQHIKYEIMQKYLHESMKFLCKCKSSGNKVPAMFDPIFIVCIYAFKFHSVSMTWTRISRRPFSRHQLLKLSTLLLDLVVLNYYG